MSDLIVPLSPDLNTVTLRAKINELRVAAGENPIRNNDFLAKVRDEVDDLGALRNFRSANSDHALAREQEIDGYELTKDQALLVGMRESKVVRKQVVKWLNELVEKVADPLAGVRDEKTRAMIQNLIRIDTLEHEVKEQDKRIRALEGLERDFVSIMGWCNVNGRDVDRIQAAAMGRQASQRCRDLGVTPSKCNHPAFGEVNTYPVGLLDELFG